jgi:hypothetical protein
MRLHRGFKVAVAGALLLAGFVATSGTASAEGHECKGAAALSGYTFSINGGPPQTTMAGNVQPGDTVVVNFTVKPECEGTQFSLVSYTAPAATYSPGTAHQQKVHDSDTGTFSGDGSLTMEVPECFYQTDFVSGAVLQNLSPPDQLYSAQGRLIDYANGGSGSCAPRPSASIAPSCTEKGGVVTLTNGGVQGVTFTITVDGGTPTTVDVAGNSTEKHVIGMTEDQVASVTVSAPGMTTKTQSVKLDCEKPAASVADQDCAKSGIDVTLTNLGGELPVTFSVQKGSDAPASVVVGPNATVVHNVAVAEDETATIKVTAPGMTDVTKTVTRDCIEDEVEGDVQTPPTGGPAVKPAVLARTGPLTDAPMLAAFGFGLVLMGSVLLRRSRKAIA